MAKRKKCKKRKPVIRYFVEAKKRRAAIKAKVDSIKASNPCKDCKHKYNPWQMQFDHISGTKVNNVSRLVAYGTLEAIMEEIAKCDLVCANCHADRTYRRQHGLLV